MLPGLAWSMPIIMASVVKMTSGGILTTCLLEDTLSFIVLSIADCTRMVARESHGGQGTSILSYWLQRRLHSVLWWLESRLSRLALAFAGILKLYPIQSRVRSVLNLLVLRAMLTQS